MKIPALFVVGNLAYRFLFTIVNNCFGYIYYFNIIYEF
jgi:hypothetical protein